MYLLNIYVYFLFLEPSVSQKNAKNLCAVLPGISVTVLASNFISVIGNFRSSGRLDLPRRSFHRPYVIIHGEELSSRAIGKRFGVSYM
jgi:hypothetical protein